MKWVFHRIRHDRDVELKNGSYYGNNYKVAETTLASILNPLSIKELISPHSVLVKNAYFKKQDDRYKMVKKFNNYVKNLLIQRYKSTSVMDLASGRGGDLKKYVDVGTSDLLMLENDIDAIDELIDRKYSILKTSKGCNLIVLKANLNIDYKLNIRMIEQSFKSADKYVISTNPAIQKKYKTVFCHFAMHYMLESEKNARNIIMFISHYLDAGGVFIITIFDGQKVFDLLKKNKGKWSADKTYMIKYTGTQPNIFAGFNNKIEVLLPLSDIPMKETLVDLTALDKIFKMHNIARIEEKNFGDMLSEYQVNNPSIQLDETEKLFIGLYKYVIYTKLK